MNKLFQTATPVHDEKQSDLSRRADHMREGAIMLGMTVFSQLLAFSALYMLPVAATSAWWGALLLIVPALLLWGFGMLAARGMPQNAFERAPYRVIAGVLAVLFLSDMAVDLLAMIELTCAFILPGTPRFWLAMIAAIAVGVGTPYKAPDAASRTARFLRWFFIGSFVFCAATVMPQGETGYLFPWAGYGVRHTLRCAALGGGGCWTAAVLPLFSHAEPRQAARRARTWLPQLVAVFMIALLLLCCAYVLPATSLSERWGFVLRLQMLMNISPSTLAWSLMLITELLLFLVAFAGSGSFLCACVKRAAKLRVPLLPFALLCVPLALIGADIAEKALMAVLPLRYPIAVLLVGMILIFNAFARKKEGKAA